jgi:glycosyltransferase involved in cell wall biosynthesis
LPENAARVADYITTLGSEFAKDTYKDSGNQITRIPLLLPTTYPSPVDKDFDVIRKKYVFIGGGGAVHKGLDRVLECFASLPDFSLTVCGPFEHETDFVEAYRKELYETSNITFVGRIDIRGERFKEIINHSVGLVYPSCSEGQSGSVITALHAGLIPIVTYESGVDVEPYGIILSDASVESVRSAVTSLSALPKTELASRAESAWKEARNSHTYESFISSYGLFIDSIVKEQKL